MKITFSLGSGVHGQAKPYSKSSKSTSSSLAFMRTANPSTPCATATGSSLYSKERDLRTVQKQLRHRSIQSTLIYADVTEEDIQNQLKGLWN